MNDFDDEDDDDELVSRAEARKEIGCGLTKLHELLNSGQLGAVKLGRRTLIPRSELRRLRKSLPAYQPAKPGRRKD